MLSIEQLGNIGEFVGSVGVLISLVYLALQVRRNTETERTRTYQSVVSDFGQLNHTLAASPDLSMLFVNAMEDFEGLSSAERARMSQLFYSSFRSFENMFYQNSRGYLEEDVWMGWRRIMLAYFHRPGFQSWWRLRRDVFSATFANYLESAVSDKVIPTYSEVAGAVAEEPQLPTNTAVDN